MTEDNCPQCRVYRDVLSSLLKEIDQQVREGLTWTQPDVIAWRMRRARIALGLNPNGTTEPNDR